MIIKSLLDTDLYKLTMMQCVYHHFPNVEVEYTFKCRNEGVDIVKIAADLAEEIRHLGELGFSDEDIEYLESLGFFQKDFLTFLKTFRLTPGQDGNLIYDLEKGTMELKFHGSWLRTILYEVPVLAMVNELYYKDKLEDRDFQNYNISQAWLNFSEDLHRIPEDMPFADFGTRRRIFKKYQRHILMEICDFKKSRPLSFVGTSNVMFAKQFGVKPIGTMAHEFICAGQGLFPLAESQKKMLDIWSREYRGKLGIALSDTLGFDAFLRDFDLYFAKLYDGLRQDSGDPCKWADKAIKHYEELGIDPKTKSLVFSDSLNFMKAEEIFKKYSDKAKISFGIGTYLTNNVPGIKPLNVVMKMTCCNGQPVAKISDSPGKGMCKDEAYLEWLKKVFEIK